MALFYWHALCISFTDPVSRATQLSAACVALVAIGCASGVVSEPGNQTGAEWRGGKRDDIGDAGAETDSAPDGAMDASIAPPLCDGDPADCDGLGACVRTPAPSEFDVHVPVSLSGDYGTHSFRVPAKTNWVNTGVYLKAGDSASVQVDGGMWSTNGTTLHGAGGAPALGSLRGCPKGALAARIGLSYEDPSLVCLSAGAGTVTALKEGPLFLGMNISTDLGETYESRANVTGELNVTVTSTAKTFPTVTRDELACLDLAQVASGHLEFAGKHAAVLLPVPALARDLATAGSSLDTLDALYEAELELRGAKPHAGQRIRFLRDDAINDIGYMLAGNPIRMVHDLVDGTDTQRILRASQPTTDVWGFAHELGHTFTFVGGTWLYMVLNLESWPNVFTLYALEATGRTAHQTNVATYCDGKAAYLAGGSYQTFKTDPFVQLCFLMEFQKAHGYGIWKNFFGLMNLTTNDQIGYDGTDASVWLFAKNRLSFVLGQDLTPVFNKWRVPLH